MGEIELHSKLQLLLKSTRLFQREMEVVYFFVELRKIMDHRGKVFSKKYKNVRFYCDWVVHTDKKYNLNDLKSAFDELYAGCKICIEQSNSRALGLVKNFLYFEYLQESLFLMFRELNLDLFILTDNDCWLSFAVKLAQILHEQPIVFAEASKSPIKEIIISHADERSAVIAILFKQPIKDPVGTEQHYLELSNGYRSIINS
jgi:hypothetical protein